MMRHGRQSRWLGWMGAGLVALVLLQTVATRAAGEDARVAAAARKGDAAGARALLRSGADVNGVEGDGATALLWAAYHSDAELVGALVAAKADVNAANRFGITPLLQASRLGNAPIVDALLKAGADPRRSHPEGETPLMGAAASGSVPTVRLLLARGADVNARESVQSQSALMWAAVEGHAAVIRTLLEAGANPNVASRTDALNRAPLGDQGRMWVDHPGGALTALMFAARNGHLDATRALLDGGADPRQVTPDGLSAMLLAVINGRFDAAALLLERGADANDGSLYEAVQVHNLRMNETTGEATRPRRFFPSTTTPPAFIASLLEKGADPMRPAAHVVHFEGSLGGGTGGRVNAANESSFARALRAQDVAALKLMLAKGADPNRLIAGVLPLASAMGAGGGRGGFAGGFGAQPAALRYPGERTPVGAVAALLDAGADVNSTGSNGDTVLHTAAQTGNVAMIQLLADRGARLDVKNAAGLTPLDLAMGRGGAARGGARPGGPPPGAGGRGGGAGGPQPQAIVLLRQLMGLPPLSPEEMPAAPAPAGPRGGL